ncbi:GNAT family N-acetyltransferase [Arcticibacter eurypsychrophilus]|uniref:GNAT family N-acetyltransferase n=1 Tax=Arcticibacter eurypsychrophilus TaxID=1434752 RepID=UPI00084DFB96|nr:GNAT family N-acetyltransferase [Arcticibacter eurypsychrophilus]
MSSTINIRTATIEDVPVIHQLAEDIWWPTYHSILSEEQLRFMLDHMYSLDALTQQINQGIIFILAEYLNNVVAFAGYSRSEIDPALLKVHKLYVQPAEHGKGIGRLLLQYIENESIKAGVLQLELNVNRQNKAFDFYKRLGFEIFKEEDIPYYKYWMNDFILRKQLI